MKLRWFTLNVVYMINNKMQCKQRKSYLSLKIRREYSVWWIKYKKQSFEKTVAT